METENPEGQRLKTNEVNIIKDIYIAITIYYGSEFTLVHFLFSNVFIVDCGCLSLIFPSES